MCWYILILVEILQQQRALFTKAHALCCARKWLCGTVRGEYPAGRATTWGDPRDGVIARADTRQTPSVRTGHSSKHLWRLWRLLRRWKVKLWRTCPNFFQCYLRLLTTSLNKDRLMIQLSRCAFSLRTCKERFQTTDFFQCFSAYWHGHVRCESWHYGRLV
jgi:hypothetical protein